MIAQREIGKGAKHTQQKLSVPVYNEHIFQKLADFRGTRSERVEVFDNYMMDTT
jgi:hypothetical protein